MHGVLKINWLDYKRVKSNFAENGKYIKLKKEGKNAETRDNSEPVQFSGFEPGTFRSSVWRSPNWAISACDKKLLFKI